MKTDSKQPFLTFIQLTVVVVTAPALNPVLGEWPRMDNTACKGETGRNWRRLTLNFASSNLTCFSGKFYSVVNDGSFFSVGPIQLLQPKICKLNIVPSILIES